MSIWNRLSNKIISSWDPVESLQKKDAIDRVFWMHFIPTDNDVTRESYSIKYSLYLGTMAAVIFTILCASGLLQMLRYVPSVERAYWSVKDLQFIFPFGWFLRDLHRISAYLLIAFVVLHLCRTFYTGSFKKGRRKTTNGWINWMTGIMLLVLTLAMAFTGYVLPWDQVGYWGANIGTNIIKSIPIIGDRLQYFVLGGNELGQNFLIRIYVLHVLLLPLLTVSFISYHFWRNRTDGGMACEDNIEAGPGQENNDSQTFSGLEKDESLKRTPMFLKRLIWVSLTTTALAVLLALLVSIPLNAPANPIMAENPAKAPWFLLWLQELVASTTVSVGQYRINGGFVGGVVVPGLLLTWLAIVPFFDNSPDAATGVWFHRSRLRQNIIFTMILLVILGLIFFTYFCRGPNWVFYWPWEVWPEVH